MKGIILKDLYENFRIFKNGVSYLAAVPQQFFSSSCLSRLCKRETYFP